jgi:hypothetical protein
MTLLSDGKLGLGVTDPNNTLDISGNAVIGATYAGSYSAPTNGLLVEGEVCIGSTTSFDDCILSVVGNVRIQGDLSMNGVINIIDTDNTTTEMISIPNDGTGPALFVKQTGNQPVAVFYDDNMPALYIQGTSSNPGNIGFNTTDPQSILHFNRSISLTNDTKYLFTFENPSGDDWRLGPYVNNNGKDTFTLFGGNTSYNNTTPLFCVDSSGNVGIGTNTPSYTLDVSGTISISMDKDVSSYFGRTAIGNPNFSDAMCMSHINYKNGQGSYALLQNSDGATYLNSASSQNMYFSINNDEKMIIDASGNVGIGTSSPTSMLDVYTSFIGANSGLYSGRIYGNDSQIGETGIRICELGSDLSANDTYPLSVLANDNYVMNVTAQGNVGIGTSAPNNKLEVPVTNMFDGICTSNSDLKMVLSIDTNSNASTIQTFTNVQDKTPNTSSNFGTLALNPLGGPVGIGLSNPSSYALEVNGIINCNDIYINTNVGVGTTNPDVPLEVIGNNTLTNPDTVDLNNAIAKFTGNDFAGVVIGSINGNSPYIADCNGLDSGNTVNSTGLRFLTNSEDRMIIDPSGNVGIGNMSPFSILHLVLSNSDDGLRIDNSSGNERIIAYTDASDNAYLQLYNSNNSGNILLDASGDSYLNGGNVGIGTTSPSSTLDVNGNFYFSGSDCQIRLNNSGNTTYFNYGSNGDHYIRSNSNNGKIILQDTGGNVGIGKNDPGNNYTLDVSGTINCDTLQIQGGAPTFSQWTTSTTNNTQIYYNIGYVGIGTASPSQMLEVSGQVQATSFNATSDFRLKKDIKPLGLCLDKVCGLQGVEFIGKDDKDDNKMIGFIAQDVEKIVPEVVTTSNDENEYKSLAYGNVTALLVEAIKELRQEVKDLRDELQSYKNNNT